MGVVCGVCADVASSVRSAAAALVLLEEYCPVTKTRRERKSSSAGVCPDVSSAAGITSQSGDRN
jgi:hypothetical protein